MADYEEKLMPDSPHTADIVEPCPFCGVAMLRLPRSFNFHHPGVVTDLDCVLSGRGYYADDVKRWNTRTPDPEAAAEIKALREALEFYAEPRSWHGVYMVGMGPMADDWSDDCADHEYPDGKPGKIARAVLKDHRKVRT